MKKVFAVALIALIFSTNLYAFCGFYVAKANAQIFNKASQVVIARDGNRTVLTMANDFQGDPREFAVVIPVPTPIQRGQINVADKALIDHLDAYTSPRLVEYFDGDPCMRREFALDAVAAAAPPAAPQTREKSARRHGVTIEAQYTVGEYDILILSAKESGGLQTWLTSNGYRMPAGAAPILGSYIKQNMRFFVAKVNVTEKKKLGYTYLRPLQVAFESPKFMLPIRLGTLNANGAQELFIYTLTKKGRVETTNYRTVKLPSGEEIPVFVKNDFANFYRAMFSQQVKSEAMRAVFLEYAWDMAWCDPCAADPLTNDELRRLGVHWLGRGEDAPARRAAWGGGSDVFVTRLHVRYDAEHFPEDLAFQETSDRQNFQTRYVLRHAWSGGSDCPEAREYRRTVARRQSEEVTRLASLTGWDVRELRRKANLPLGAAATSPERPWWEDLWNW